MREYGGGGGGGGGRRRAADLRFSCARCAPPPPPTDQPGAAYLACQPPKHHGHRRALGVEPPTPRLTPPLISSRQHELHGDEHCEESVEDHAARYRSTSRSA